MCQGEGGRRGGGRGQGRGGDEVGREWRGPEWREASTSGHGITYSSVHEYTSSSKGVQELTINELL